MILSASDLAGPQCVKPAPGGTTTKPIQTPDTTPPGFAAFFQNAPLFDKSVPSAVQGGLAQAAGATAGQAGNFSRISNAVTNEALTSLGNTQRREAEADSAAATVRANLDRANDANQRNLMRAGVMPGSGRMDGNADAVNAALAQTTAAQGARTAYDDAALRKAGAAGALAGQGAQLHNAALAGQLDASRLLEAGRQFDVQTGYQTEALNRQTQQNAAELALRKYQIETGVALNNQQMKALTDQQKGQNWQSAVGLGLGFLQSTGLGGKIGDAVTSGWNWLTK